MVLTRIVQSLAILDWAMKLGYRSDSRSVRIRSLMRGSGVHTPCRNAVLFVLIVLIVNNSSCCNQLTGFDSRNKNEFERLIPIASRRSSVLRYLRVSWPIASSSHPPRHGSRSHPPAPLNCLLLLFPSRSGAACYIIALPLH